ncbi:MAG: hypothetical protein AB1405_12250 [Bdellovibrionota bacterium]
MTKKKNSSRKKPLKLRSGVHRPIRAHESRKSYKRSREKQVLRKSRNGG